MSLIKRLANFIKYPRIPWFMIKSARKVSFFLGKFLQYGRLNINTKNYWDNRWASGTYQKTEDERHSERRNKILEPIKPGSKVLDVGCGSGSLMHLLRDRLNCSCTGIDISEVSINLVKGMGFEGYVTELPKLPPEILNRKFDFVIAEEVLEHLKHPDETLKALKNVLKPGGKLIATVPNDCMKPGETDDHVNAFTVEPLQTLISPYFKIEKCVTVKSWIHESCGKRYDYRRDEQ